MTLSLNQTTKYFHKNNRERRTKNLLKGFPFRTYTDGTQKHWYMNEKNADYLNVSLELLK